MSTSITYNEISKAIAAVLTRHPQLEPLFCEFEKLPWNSHVRGMIKRNPSGGTLIAERSVSGTVDLIFNATGELDN